MPIAPAVVGLLRDLDRPPDDLLYGHRVRTLARAQEPGSVRATCWAMGIYHPTFCRSKKQAERYRLDMLRPRESDMALQSQSTPQSEADGQAWWPGYPQASESSSLVRDRGPPASHPDDYSLGRSFFVQ